MTNKLAELFNGKVDKVNKLNNGADKSPIVEQLKFGGKKRMFSLVPRMTDEKVVEIIVSVGRQIRREEKECCICGEDIPYMQRKICCSCKKEMDDENQHK